MSMSWAALMTACRDVGRSAASSGPKGRAGTGAVDDAGLCGAAARADAYVFLFVAALLLPEPVSTGDMLPAAGSGCWFEITTALLRLEPVPGGNTLPAAGGGCWVPFLLSAGSTTEAAELGTSLFE